jgi:hypothetical protein
VPQDHKVLKDQWETVGPRDRKEFKDHRDHREFKDPKDRKV